VILRPVGCDIEIGQCLLSLGQVIGASEIGLLASVGVTSIKGYHLPRVGVMSTGNEVLPSIMFMTRLITLIIVAK